MATGSNPSSLLGKQCNNSARWKVNATPYKKESIIKNKNHSFEESKAYKPKSWCDAQDYEGVWRLGRVRKAEGENFNFSISIHQ